MIVRFLVISLAIVASACSSALAETPSGAEFDSIHVPISLYVVLSDSGEAPSSIRTVDEVSAIADRAAEIWGQAGIVLDIRVITHIEVSDEAMRAARSTDGRLFLHNIYANGDQLPDPGRINGFYTPFLSGVNGFASVGTKIFFVTDDPTVHDERVTSHEIGHILGLHHVTDDPGRLMASGTNGITLTDTEIAVARYAAQGILDAVR